MKDLLNSFSRFRMVAILLVCSLILACCYTFMPRPYVLHLGIFAGSNWNVPGSNVYAIIDDAIARYEKAHPGIKVEYDSGIRREDYSEWLSGKLLQGEMPDVFMVLDSDFPTLAGIDALYDLDRFANGLDGIDRERFYPAALEGGIRNGRLYALPYESNPQFMFVNLSLLEKEGAQVPDENWTLDDLYQIAAQVTRDTDQDGQLDQFGIYSYGWQNALLAYGEQAFEPDGSRARLQNQNVRQAIDYSFRLNALNQNVPVSQADFDAGHAAFSPMTYAEYKTYKPYPWKIKKFSRFDWTIVPMPASEAGQNSSAVDSLVMSISSSTRRPREAWDLLKTLCFDDETQQMIMEYSQGLPCLRSRNDASRTASQDPLASDIAAKVMERSRATPRFPNYDHIVSLLDLTLRSTYEQAEDKDLFMIELQKSMDDALRSKQ